MTRRAREVVERIFYGREERAARVNWDGDEYQRRFDELAASGVDVHGEATFVAAYSSPPTTVLDAGCGTGRVAIELARAGIEVVGVDVDASMLATAREHAAAVEWVLADLATLDLGRAFDVVVMAGNVPLFTPKGTEAALVAGLRRARRRRVDPRRRLPARPRLRARRLRRALPRRRARARRALRAPGTGRRSRPTATTPSPSIAASSGRRTLPYAD